jgi:uncharacterized membrane protein
MSKKTKHWRLSIHLSPKLEVIKIMIFSTSLISWNHIHPVLVHFSTALIPASLASDLFGKYLKRDSLTAGAWWMMFYGAIATPITAFAGWMWASQFDRSAAEHLPGLSTHMWLGFFLTLAFGTLAIWRGKIFAGRDRPSIVYMLTGALVVGALMYQGFLGGQMTIG